MAVLFKRNANEGGLDARIAELSARRGRFEPVPPPVQKQLTESWKPHHEDE